MLIIIQEAKIPKSFVPIFMLKTLARIVQNARQNQEINQDKGVSVRMGVHSLELLVGEAERTRALSHNIIAVPRATGSHERWVVASRMAAIASGAFVISSNRAEDQWFGGCSLVVGPDGDVLASTSRQAPFATVDIDLAESTRAKKTYPRDLLE